VVDDKDVPFGTLMDLLRHPEVSYAFITVRTFMPLDYEYAIDQ
jgi:hypothetical protein